MLPKGSHETSTDTLDLLICTALRQEQATSSTRVWRRIEKRIRHLVTLQAAARIILLEGRTEFAPWQGWRYRLLMDDIL